MTFYGLMSIIDILSYFVNTIAMENQKQMKVVEAARTVFLRYGYKRVTMHDIAEAASISRPALYLVFSNKEEVFKAVVKQMAAQNLNEIRQGVDRFASIEEKLQYAFEHWTVRPYELIMSAPDAKELIYCCYEFSREVFEEVGAAFEAELFKLIQPLLKANDATSISGKMTATILRNAVRGFKDAAENAAELRRMIKGFLAIVMLALDPARHQNKSKNITRVIKQQNSHSTTLSVKPTS